ncbi:hypothetical protein L1887_36933 [Cichorium endivia]|nr:hypothetical protein L1887_36933 [Cichorium endivia]
MGDIQKFDEDKKVEGEEQQDEGLASKIWDCGSPLYDSYELVSIAHVIEMHQMIFPYVINGSARSVIHPSSYLPSSSVPQSLPMSHPSRKMNYCSFMPSFKLWKMKMNICSKVKVGALKICHKIVS